MKIYTKADLQTYLQDDWIMDMLVENLKESEREIRTNQWLMEMDNKRLIYSDVYGDLLKTKSELKVLDVGGGYNSFTKVLAAHTQYTLLDFMAHGGGSFDEIAVRDGMRWINKDWYKVPDIGSFDIIIANDIFPDVDQRMELFIERMLPHCSELRLVITYYNSPWFYTTKRVDDAEVMTFLSWDGEITGMKLKKYLTRLDATEADIEMMRHTNKSIYRNGRQVAYTVVRGDL